MKLKILTLIVIALLATVVRAQETVTIDLAVNNGPATYRASGMHYGILGTTPASSLVTPLKLREVRNDYPLVAGLSQYDPNLYPRIAAQPAHAILILGDVWIGNGNPSFVDSTSMSSWLALVTSIVNGAIANGQTFEWDVWNEPDLNITAGWTGTEAQFQTMWAATVNTIRGIDPAQVIMGPSACCNITWMTDTLTYAKTNNVLPNIVAFHEFGGPAAAATDISNLKSFLAANDPSLTLIAIPEMMTSSETYLPGTNVQYLAAVERAQIQGAGKACWFSDCFAGSVSGSNLSGLIGTDLTTIHAAWYAWQGYANVNGTIVGVTPSATVDGIAGASASPCQASGVFGRNGATSTVTYTFTNISTNYACLNVGGNVQAAVYTLANDGGAGSGGPVLLSNAAVAVSGNAISVTVPNMGTNDAAIIQLTPAGGGGNGGPKSYYADYLTGSDTAAGTKLAPWKYAPGMAACSAKCASTVLNAGDSLYLKGGVTWHNESFSWIFPYSGTPGNPIYVGVDPTWFIGASWTRPIMNLDNAPPSDSLYRIMCVGGGGCNGGVTHDVTFDNFEWTNIAALQNSNPGSATTSVFSGFPTAGNVVTEDMYVHGWHNPCYAFGTATLTAGSNIITNFVPGVGSLIPNATWGSNGSGACKNIGLQAGGNAIPFGNSAPTVTSVSGTGPYTVTFYNTGQCGGNAAPCWAQSSGTQFVSFGSDNLLITSGGDGPSPAGEMMYRNVIDGSDVDVAVLNPWPDCGLLEGNNNVCRASATGAWRSPSVWKQNVIRYIYQVSVAQCRDWDGNLIEDIRFSPNPTAHTNVVECVADDAPNNQTYFHDNLLRNANNPNPNTPDGRWSIGLGMWSPVPNSGETDFVFNNVMYNGIQNQPLEPDSLTGAMLVFNNTMDCGPAWSLTYSCGGAPVVASNRYLNNHFISAPSNGHFLANDNGAGNGCTGYACNNNLALTPTIATADGYTTAQQYAYSPTSGSSPTVGTGTSIVAICASILDAAARLACGSDTSYGVGYNTTNHTVLVPARTPVVRAATPDIGAFQFVAGSPAAAVHLVPAGVAFRNQVVATTSTSQTITLTNSGTATLNITSIVLMDLTNFGESNSCTPTLAVGISCNVYVTFKPSSATSFSTTVVFTTNAGSSPDSVTLTGTGISSGAPIASLSDFQYVNSAINNVATTTSPVSVTINGTQPGQLLNLALYVGWTGTVSAATISTTQITSIVDQHGTQFSYGANAFTNYTNTSGLGGANVDAYLISPGGNETVTVTFNSTGGGGSTLSFYEEVLSLWAAGNGTISFDTDVSAFANNGAGAFPIVLPSITPAAAGELLIESIADQGTPTTGTPWVAIPVTGSGDTSYILSSASGATTANWTGSGADSYATSITAFKPSVALGVFGNQTVGTSSPKQTIVLTNAGTTALLISSIGIPVSTYSGYFGQTNTCPTSLAAGANCTISVGFLPIAAGSVTATVSIADNAAGSPHTVALSGTGTAVVGGQVIFSHPASAHLTGLATYTFTIPAPAIGNAEICELDGFSNVTVTSITHGGDLFTQSPGARSTNANGTAYTWTDIWYKLGMGNAGTSVTLQLSGVSGIDYHCQEASGGSIAFANAAGYTNSTGVFANKLIGPTATLSGANGFVVGISAQLSANVVSAFASGGQTFSVSDISSGNAAVNLLNVPAGSYAPGYNYDATSDNTVSSSTASFTATGGPIAPHLNKVIVN